MQFLDFDLKLSRRNGPKWVGLGSLSLIYKSLVWVRKGLYKIGIKKRYKAKTGVISIGNITVGGTGKTPMISWMIQFCQREKIKAAVLTRGYKAQRKEHVEILNRETSKTKGQDVFGDEPWLLYQNHQEVSFYVSPDRIAAAKLAVDTSELLLLDDGMQHLKLVRDLEIVLLDSTAGIGNGRLLPLGPLREPLNSLKRADVVIFTKTNLNSSKDLRDKLSQYILPHIKQYDSTYLPTTLFSSKDGQSHRVENLNGKKCLLFSGIGNPMAFVNVVEKSGGNVVNHLVMEDHHLYTKESIEKIRLFASRNSHDYLLCTEKDWVKLESFAMDLPHFYCVKMKMEIEKDFEAWLKGQIKEIVNKH